MDLPGFNFFSNKDHVKLCSASPDNSYSKRFSVLTSICFLDPPMKITPLVVGEVNNVLANLFA